VASDRAPGLIEVRCHHCSKFVGESAVRLKLVGVVESRELREKMDADRFSWLCKCGWTTVFKAA
jgi:hypothetical protein